MMGSPSRPVSAPSGPGARRPRPESARGPEAELLIACARPSLSAETAARVQRLAEGAPDWDRVLRLARRHGLVSFLHRHLPPASVPAPVIGTLRALHREAAHQGLTMAGELRRLLALFDAAGIDALAYKGPALAVQAYGDLSLRSFVDLDLLVRPESIPRALDLLSARGYAPALDLSPAQERCFRRVDGDYPLVHRETDLLVELHARVSSRRFCMPIRTDDLLRRARAVRVGGGEVKTLGDDDLLVSLCVHGAKHRWKRLEWLAALAALLRAGRGDVPAALRLAAEVRARRTVLLGLSLAHRLLGAPLSADVVREIDGDPGIAALGAEAEARLFDDEGDGDETVANLRFNLRARDSRRDRARYAARWLFAPSPEDWRWARLPDALFPLYRVLRPVRLLLRHGRGG